MLKQLPIVALGRNLTQQEWEVVNSLDEAVNALFRARLHQAGLAKSSAERAHIRAVEEAHLNPRYRELLVTDLTGANPDVAHPLMEERRRLEQPMRDADAAKKRAADAHDDLDIERSVQTFGACFLAGEVNGFRLGLQVFATLMTQPDKWVLTPGTPATAVVATLLTDLGYCSEVVSKLMAEPEADTKAAPAAAS